MSKEPENVYYRAYLKGMLQAMDVHVVPDDGHELLYQYAYGAICGYAAKHNRFSKKPLTLEQWLLEFPEEAGK